MKKMALYAFVCGAFACTCDLSYGYYIGSRVADDGFVQAMGKKPGRPTSVSEAIEKIKEVPNLEKETELDLSGNRIGKRGVMQFLEFIVSSDKLKSLERVNFANNEIPYDSSEDLLEKFKELLKLPNIKAVNIIGNGCARYEWVDFLRELVTPDEMFKLVWVDKEGLKELLEVEQAVW